MRFKNTFNPIYVTLSALFFSFLYNLIASRHLSIYSWRWLIGLGISIVAVFHIQLVISLIQALTKNKKLKNNNSGLIKDRERLISDKDKLNSENLQLRTYITLSEKIISLEEFRRLLKNGNRKDN